MKKIEDFLDKEKSIARLPKYNRVVILSDSNGKYLGTEIEKLYFLNIEFVWWTSSGRNTTLAIKFLVDHIQELQDGISTLVLFWHFTCDLAVKEGSFIHQRYPEFTDIETRLKPMLDSLKEIHLLEDNIDIGILEIPPMFTKQWNRSKNYPNWEIINDTVLHQHIQELNNLIREYNCTLNYHSPRFMCDFIHRRRNSKKGRGNTKTKENLHPMLLKDGVHPIEVVA